MVSLVSSVGAVLYSSPAVTRMLGYGVREFLGINVFELVHEDDAQAARRLFASCLQERPRPTQAELRCRHRDGSFRDLDAVGVNYIGEPTVGAIVLTFHDQSDRKRAERALEASRAFLEKAQEVAHLGSWETDLTGAGRVTWSDEAHRIFGVPRGSEDLVHETFYRIVHPEDLEMVRKAVEAAVAGERRYSLDHRIVRPGGDVRRGDP